MSRLLQTCSGLLALAAAALVAFRVWSAAPPVVAPPAVYAPTPAVVSPGELFEQVSPASGFILVVEATPDAALFIDGKHSGDTPASLNFECKPGQSYAFKLVAEGYRPLERTLACRKDTMLLLKARLEAKRR